MGRPHPALKKKILKRQMSKRLLVSKATTLPTLGESTKSEEKGKHFSSLILKPKIAIILDKCNHLLKHILFSIENTEEQTDDKIEEERSSQISNDEKKDNLEEESESSSITKSSLDPKVLSYIQVCTYLPLLSKDIPI